ncbi:MAG: putative beta-lysine N-acetyltransferase [Planctomycetota bacterium]
MCDTVATIGTSKIQHGKASDRVYVMKLSPHEVDVVVEHADTLAAEHGYTKLFAKVPAAAGDTFARAGYRTEATIPALFNDEPGLFLGKYLDDARADAPEADRLRDVLELAMSKADRSTRPLPDGVSLRTCTPEDAEAMATLYREVFDTYPFPIHDPAYLRETMDNHVAYVGAWQGDTLIALASAEMDLEAGHAEMTDFATRPDCRGQGLATHLLIAMEAEMIRRGLRTAYTIARAASAGMNITFARQKYLFAGTLVNNTDIAGRIESMNVWYKPLA